MPTYLITNPATGRQLKITGPAPPSESFIQASFNKLKPPPKPPLQALQPYFTGGVDLVLGAIGLGQETKANQVGQLIAAALPLAGGVKALKAAAAQAKAVQQARTIKAYHGSPHDFDKFSMDKIGTGEGAQSYGHGLYFAENPETAKSYRDGLSRPTLTHQGQPLPEPVKGRDFLKLNDTQIQDEGARDLLRTAQKNIAHGADMNSVVEYAAGEARVLANRGDKPHWLGVERRIREMAKDLSVNDGKMYEVNINADPEQFLDWDAPLSQQGPAAREGAIKAMKARGLPVGDDGVPLWVQRDPRGESIHASLSPSGKPTKFEGAKASKLLNESGIPGIKYLDQGSRTAGQGTRNYVVFDDTLVSIVKKYMVAGFAFNEAVKRAQAEMATK